MSKQEIYDFLRSMDVCRVCVLRYMNGRCTDYLDVDKSLREVRGIEFKEDKNNDQVNGDQVNGAKRQRNNICTACLGIFQNDLVERTVQDILQNSNLPTYDCDTIYSSVTLPIILQIRELSIWIAMLKRFPDAVDPKQIPNISIKEIFKFLVNMRLCKETQRTLEQNQNGILVHVSFEHDDDKEEVRRLDSLQLIKDPKINLRQKWRKHVSRNSFEKAYFPSNLTDIDACVQALPVPPNVTTNPVRMTGYTIAGPTVFVAGRYRKVCDHLSQSPWVLDGKRVMEDSVHEIIASKVTPYFGVEPFGKIDTVNFMASGREDVDVRCLGNGRPFVLEISNARKVKLPVEIAADMENCIDASAKVSVHHLQMIKREELGQIKTGEETKKKIYRALCILKRPATVEMLAKMDMPNGVLISQETPLRVLHRRPLLSRPRQVYSVKPYVVADNHLAVVLDIVTQAGTYVKEFVHGEFGRTEPSVSSIIGEEIDIVALDVNGIDLDWPPAVDNKLLSRQQKKRILIESVQ